jgi:peptidoglycan/LPS O-acetylase OafA/YrhL
MRFIAAALVFFFHGATDFLFKSPRITSDYLRTVSNAGSLGVSFFFVLSGFVLTWSMRPGDTTLRFWRRRVFKIVPNHVVTFSVALILIAFAGEAIALWPTLMNLFLVDSWVPKYSYINSADGVSWSLSCEALFYLCFPLLILAIRRIRPAALWGTAGALAGVSILLPYISLHFLPSTPVWPWGPSSWAQIWFVYVLPATRMVEFALGIVMARIVLTGKWIKLPLPVAALLLAGAYVATLYGPWHFLYNYVAVTIIPVALLIPAAAAADVKGLRTGLSGRTMVWLGEISFAFYLVHWLVLSEAQRLFGVKANPLGLLAGPSLSTWGAVAFLAVCFVVSIALAWLLYSSVERPMMRRFANPKRVDQAAAAEADLVPAGQLH